MRYTLRNLRNLRGLTQKELAQGLHVSTPTIIKWEKDIGKASVNDVGKILSFFKISSNEFSLPWNVN